MLVAACGVAVTAAVLGVYLSFFIDSAPAPTIVLLLTAIFIVAFAVSVRRAHSRPRSVAAGSVVAPDAEAGPPIRSHG
jgi:manganese/iron transport system permease protein